MLRNPFRTFRDHRLSIFQAAAADAVRPDGSAPMPDLQRAAAAVASLDAAGLVVPPSGPADLRPEAWTCARLGLDLLRAELGGDAADRARLEDALAGSRCDPRWAGTLLSYLGYFGRDGLRRRIPYIRPEAAGPEVIEIADNARIALLSDWGTGRRTAAAVLRDLARHQPDIVVHLGDIYYAGTAAECEDNFRLPMHQALDRARRHVPVYTLSGNHDMYSGGEGYYGLIGRLNDGPWRQRASFFCLRSAGWQFIGMDTGLHAYDPFEQHPLTFLELAEEDWVAARIGEFPGQTVLLSHHPLFSLRRALERAGRTPGTRICSRASGASARRDGSRPGSGGMNTRWRFMHHSPGWHGGAASAAARSRCSWPTGPMRRCRACARFLGCCRHGWATMA